MFKITLLYQSDVEGVYTKEEETATNEEMMNFKRNKMMDEWFKILCPHIDFEKFIKVLFKTVQKQL